MHNLEIDFNEVRLNKIEKYGFAEFDIYGYQISIPVDSNYKHLEESYLNHIKNDLGSLYGRIIKMENLLELDLMLDRIKDNNFNK
jgi:hypothetical protein